MPVMSLEILTSELDFPQLAAGGAVPRIPAGKYYWQAREHDLLTVRVCIVPHSRIGVDLWWNRVGGPADIQALFGIYESSVELGSLRGNGYDTPAFHRRGFGTFVVNTAVQALQACADPGLHVHGVLSNTHEYSLPPEQRATLDHNRAQFWRRFGLEVVCRGSPALDYLRGSVGSMRVVHGGLLAAQFPRCVPLGEFCRTPPEGL